MDTDTTRDRIWHRQEMIFELCGKLIELINNDITMPKLLELLIASRNEAERSHPTLLMRKQIREGGIK